MTPDQPRSDYCARERSPSVIDQLVGLGSKELCGCSSQYATDINEPLLLHSPASVVSMPRPPSLCLVQDACNTTEFQGHVDDSSVDEEGDEHEEGGKRRFGIGLLLANIATVAFSLQMLFVKLLSISGPPSMQLLMARLIIHTAAVLACCGLGLFGFHGRFWRFETRSSAWLCAAIGISNLVVIMLLYYATSQLSLALATVIYFTSPIWSGVWKTLFLGDPYSYADGAFSLCSFIAVCVVTLPHEKITPSSNMMNAGCLRGIVAALMSGSLQALAYVLVQVVRRQEEQMGVPPHRRVHWLQINMANAVFGAVLCPLALYGPFQFQTPVPLSTMPVSSLLELAGIGVFTVVAQFTLVQSQSQLEACTVTIIRSLDVGYALFYQSLFISHIPPTVTDVTGVILLVLSCVGSASHSRLAALRSMRLPK